MPQIDGLRTVAVFAAMLSHYLPETCKIINYGHAGVQLFFVISGFLITGILLQCRSYLDAANQGAPGSYYLKQFYIRRIIRISPLYFGVIAALSFSKNFQQSLPYHLTYTSNIYMGVTGITVMANHFWSLCVEEQFYLFWPFLILFAQRKYLYKIMVVLILSSLASRIFCLLNGYPWQTMYFLTSNLDCLSAGGILALVWRDRPGEVACAKIIKIAGRLGWVALALMIMLSVAFPQSGGLGFKSRYILQNSVFSLLFFAVVHRAAVGYPGLLGKFLNLAAVKYLGRISYGLYVFHPFVPNLLRSAHAKLNFPLAEGAPFVLSSLAVTVLIASASWHLFESPVNNLKRYFPYKSPRLEAWLGNDPKADQVGS